MWWYCDCMVLFENAVVVVEEFLFQIEFMVLSQGDVGGKTIVINRLLTVLEIVFERRLVSFIEFSTFEGPSILSTVISVQQPFVHFKFFILLLNFHVLMISCESPQRRI